MLADSALMMLILNALPVVLITITLFFITGNFVATCTVSGFLFMALSAINYLKITLRYDPFIPWDVALGGEVLNIIPSYIEKYFSYILLGIIGGIIIFLAAFLLIKNQRISVIPRIVSALAGIIIILTLNFTVYSNSDINANIYVDGSPYNAVDSFNSKGFVYSFIYTFNTSKVSYPTGYDEKAVENCIEDANTEISASESDNLPHIIAIMSESYSDISNLDAFDFGNYTDPMTTFNSIAEESISGHIVVPCFGGNTSDTEFEFLMGMNRKLFDGVPYAYRLITSDTPGMPGILSRVGYTTSGMHPFYDWYYNRRNVYQFIGFDESLFFFDYFNNRESKGGYISEASTFDAIIERMEEHLAVSDNPFFEFCVTLQNHMPYFDKYFPGEYYRNFDSDMDFTDDEINSLSNYFEGISDSDTQLQRLTDYLNGLDVPVILVFFGDHLPSLFDNTYEKIIEADDSTVETATLLNQTPFFIWQNNAAEDTLDIYSSEAGMPENMLISANYLGGYLMELISLGETSEFFSYSNKLRTEYPVLYQDTAYDMQGVPSAGIISGEDARLKLYRDWQFYSILSE